jgi:N-acetylglutamate synthase-like GNAT family acetyltransferase
MTSPLSIRLAVTSEREELEALQLRSSLNNSGDRGALLANPDAIHLPVEQIASGQVFVAEQDGVVVGFAAVLQCADGQTEVDGLFVEPDIWKKGIGRSLIERCVAFAHAQGATFLHVIGNPHAAGFYTACSFEVAGTHETRFGMGLSMRKELAVANERPDCLEVGPPASHCCRATRNS